VADGLDSLAMARWWLDDVHGPDHVHGARPAAVGSARTPPASTGDVRQHVLGKRAPVPRRAHLLPGAVENTTALRPSSAQVVDDPAGDLPPRQPHNRAEHA
jgi:hypothetical protein